VTTLFQRAATLQVQNRELVGMDFDFRVDRSLTPSQNTADITVYGLAESSRKSLQQCATGIFIKLCAGYTTDAVLPTLFYGQLREVRTVRNGADWQTEISSGDADEEKARPVDFSLGPGATFEAAIKRLAEKMGGKIGNLAATLKDAKFSDSSKEFTEGMSVFGNGDDELRKLLASGGLTHSWQNGELQILPLGKALSTSAVTLDETSGLIGSPELGENDTVKFRSLLNAEITPGRTVHVISRNLDGHFRAERVVYTGSISGNDWFADVEGAPPK
jgi:hypothetical protein